MSNVKRLPEGKAVPSVQKTNKVTRSTSGSHSRNYAHFMGQIKALQREIKLTTFEEEFFRSLAETYTDLPSFWDGIEPSRTPAKFVRAYVTHYIQWISSEVADELKGQAGQLCAKGLIDGPKSSAEIKAYRVVITNTLRELGVTAAAAIKVKDYHTAYHAIQFAQMVRQGVI